MKIIPIFEGNIKLNECNLWSVCYPEDRKNAGTIFRQLFELWNDTEYLQEFFIKNQNNLLNEIWKGISIDEAVDQVLDERLDFESELKKVEAKHPGYENMELSSIFEELHKNEFRFRRQNKYHRKAKPFSEHTVAMIRIYGIELREEEGCYIVTGGGIKLTDDMKTSGLDGQIRKIERVQDFLKGENILNRNDLIQRL